MVSASKFLASWLVVHLLSSSLPPSSDLFLFRYLSDALDHCYVHVFEIVTKIVVPTLQNDDVLKRTVVTDSEHVILKLASRLSSQTKRSVILLRDYSKPTTSSSSNSPFYSLILRISSKRLYLSHFCADLNCSYDRFQF